MDDADSTPKPETAGKPLTPPTNRVIGSVDTAMLGEVVPDLIAAGFAPVGILAGEAGLRRLRATSDPPGAFGFLGRFGLSMGGDLDIMQRAEGEMAAGRAMVDFEVEGEEAKERARDVFLRHGGRFVTFIGRWELEELA